MKKVITVFCALLTCLMISSQLIAQPSGSSIFQEYPWLSELVNEEGCTTERVDVYESGIFTFILVTDDMNVSSLYNMDGQFYCQSTSNYDCVALYNLEAPVDSWTCGVVSTNCEADDQFIAALIQGYDSGGCYVTTSVSQFEYEGNTYFRTYRGRTRNGIEQSENICPAQEFFGEIRDCDFNRICAFGLFPLGTNTDPVLCDAVLSGQVEETVIWINPDSECPDTDPLLIPVIQEAINREPIIGIDGELCETIKEIVEFEVYGFTYYKIDENPGCASDDADRFYDCEGNYVGGIGFAPLCQSATFCTILNNASTVGEVIWSSEATISNVQLFEDYPWLSDKVDQDNCTTERVDLYQTGNFYYLIVTESDGTETMYNSEGLFYCQSGQNLDCIAAYNLGSPIDSWFCGGENNGGGEECDNTGTIIFDICGDGLLFYLIEMEDGSILDPYFPADSDYIPVEGQVVNFGYNESAFQTPCPQAESAIDVTCIEVVSTPMIAMDCSTNTGTVFFEQCDNGTEYFFVRTSTGEVLDIYFAPGLEQVVTDGQEVNFDFVPASFSSPCSIADQAVIITCFENKVITADIFSDYPFLSDLVDIDNCADTYVSEYELGGFSFLYIGTSESDGQLYRYDGVFYCESSVGYSCVDAYGFGAPLRTWNCASGIVGTQTDIAKSRSLASSAEMSVYPNPTSGIITLNLMSMEAHTQRLTVVDLQGRVLYKQEVQPNTVKVAIDLSPFQNGIYYLSIMSEEHQQVEKIVKQ